MKVLVLGGRGMAGHVLVQSLLGAEHEVWWTERRRGGGNRGGGGNGRNGDATDGNIPKQSIGLDVRDRVHLYEILRSVRPDVTVNAVGMLNQNAEQHPSDAILVNSLLPHWLVQYANHHGSRIVHISTDCVFDGRRGGYTEADVKDGTSVYAKTKSLGEIVNGRDLTIRTSIIGPELNPSGIGLFHWFMSQKGVIGGYRNVRWNGVTTLELAKIVTAFVNSLDERTPGVDGGAVRGLTQGHICSTGLLHPTGLVHLTGPSTISKYHLLSIMRGVFHRPDILIEPKDDVHSDKTLVNTRGDFRPAVPDYETMLQDMLGWMMVHPSLYQHIYALPWARPLK